MEPYDLVAYVIAGMSSLAAAYIIARLRWPRWAYWLFAFACFTGSVLIVELLHPWSAESPWPNAIRIGLVAIAGASAGTGFHGGLAAHLRPNNSPERTRDR